MFKIYVKSDLVKCIIFSLNLSLALPLMAHRKRLEAYLLDPFNQSEASFTEETKDNFKNLSRQKKF